MSAVAPVRLPVPGPAEASIVETVHRRVVDGEVDLTLEPTALDDDRSVVAAAVRREAPLLPAAAVDDLTEQVLARVVGLGPLQPLLDDDAVTDILVNGDGTVWVERAGRLERVALRMDEATTLFVIERIVGPLGLRIDRASPMVDARLRDGSRVHAIVRPLAVDGPSLAIRRFAVRTQPLASFASDGVVELLRWAVRSRANVLVCGGTGAGKTTLLNALAAEIAPEERIVTIEDTAELRLPGEHVVRLECRHANTEGVGGEVRIRDLVRNALRMRPDRVVIGEVRGGEALDLLQAMNTGHEGSLSTCHANGPADALRRLETMVLMGDVGLPLAAVREQIVAALDLVVQVARQADGRRTVIAAHEVHTGLDAEGRPHTRVLVDDGGLRTLPVRPSRGEPSDRPTDGWFDR